MHTASVTVHGVGLGEFSVHTATVTVQDVGL